MLRKKEISIRSIRMTLTWREAIRRIGGFLAIIFCLSWTTYASELQNRSIMKASPGHNAYLYERERLTSPSGNFTLLMQTDGNLVLYKSECVENPSCAVWQSGTFRERGQYYLAMQDDGNLVIYRGRPPDDASKAIWNTRTFLTKSNYFLSLQDDGSLVICMGTGPSDNKGVIWSSMAGTIKKVPSSPSPPQKGKSVLIASPGHNAYLYERERLTSPSGNFTLLMQTDGNLVLYKSECVENPSCAVWQSGTFRERGQYYLAMQDDGNLVIYRGRPPDDASKAIWNTRTFLTKSNYFLSLQDDGSLVICMGTGPSDNKGVIWSSK